MSVIRANKNKNYSVISNVILADEKLSWRARGIAAYLLTRPENWRINSDNLTRMGTEGRDAVRSAMKELETVGYLQRIKTRNSDGTWATELVLNEFPFNKPSDNMSTDDGLSGVGLSGVGLSGANVITVLSTDSKNTTTTHAHYVRPDESRYAPSSVANTNGVTKTSVDKDNAFPVKGKEKATKTNGQVDTEQASSPYSPDNNSLCEQEPTLSAKKAKAAHPMTKPILDAYVEARGANGINYGKESSWAKKIAEQNGTPELVKECYTWMKAQEFWRYKVLSLAKIYETLPEYIAYKTNNPGQAQPEQQSFLNASDLVDAETAKLLWGEE